jgi:uncharacterized cupredoxin-like copper-binding protein
MVRPTDRGDRRIRIRILVVGCTVGLIAGACGGPAAAPSSPAAVASSVPTAVPSAATTPTTSTATRTPAPTPIPTLQTTTIDATVAPAGAISVKLAWQAPRFEPDQITAKAGTVVFFLRMSPDGSLANHNLAIGRKIHEVLASSGFVQPTKSAVFTVTGLQAGTYTFWCQVPAHAANGMVGQLTITP